MNISYYYLIPNSNIVVVLLIYPPHTIAQFFGLSHCSSQFYTGIPYALPFISTAKKLSNTFSRTLAYTSSRSRVDTFPSLLVIEIDNTLWTPDLYRPQKLQRNNRFPVAHKDVKLSPAGWDVIQKNKKWPRLCIY